MRIGGAAWSEAGADDEGIFRVTDEMPVGGGERTLSSPNKRTFAFREKWRIADAGLRGGGRLWYNTHVFNFVVKTREMKK